MSEPNTESESNSQKEENPAGNTEDMLVQYVVLRRDTIDTCPMGSIVTQGCRASVSAIWAHKKDPQTLQYCSLENIDSMHKKKMNSIMGNEIGFFGYYIGKLSEEIETRHQVQKDMAIELVVSIIGKIGETCLFEPIGRGFGYLKHSSSNIKTLEEELSLLEGVRKDVQTSIETAKRAGEIIKDEVHNWIDIVDRVLPEARKIVESKDTVNKRCFNMWCPDLTSRYLLSQESERITIEMAKLKDDSKFNGVTKPAASPEIVSNQDFVKLESTEVAMMGLMEALKDSETKFIGLHGMGGVGKTALVTEIAKKSKEDKLFDAVLIAKVSQNVDVKNIQLQLAEALGFKLEDTTEHVRAGQLHGRLTNESKVLIILDNVWVKLDIGVIGIPFGNEGCKIVVTTRRRQVCNAMVRRSETMKIIPLNVLSDGESWELFKLNYGNDTELSKFESEAKKLCRECGGLPIALETVGRAMRGKQLRDWKAAARELQKSQPIEGMENVVYKCLESSFDYIKNGEKREVYSLFLLCCLFPKDYDIPIELLVRYGFGLEIFEGVSSIPHSRDRAHSIINNLKDSCLLLRSNGGGFIKLHHVVRGAAKSFASDDYFVKAGEEWNEWPSDPSKLYTGISVMHNRINGYPDARKWDCSNLQILLMQSNYIPLPMPEEMFKGMKALKVLDQSSSFCTETMFFWRELEPVFAYLTNLQTLIIRDCMIADSTGLGHLKSLQILSLAYCKLQRQPLEIRELMNLRLLDLEECTLSKEVIGPIFPPNEVIPRLSRLEELYMSSGLTGSSGLIITELKSLPRLTTLTLCISDFGCIPEGFTFPDVEVFKLYTSDLSFDLTEVTETNFLGLSGLVNGEKMLAIPSLGCFKSLLRRTNHLYLSSFKGSRNVLPYLLPEIDGLPFLRSMGIDNCDEIENLINPDEWEIPPSGEQHQPNCFLHLEKLVLSSLQTFKGLCKGAFPIEMSLRELVLTNLPELEHIWKGPSGLFHLHNLQIVDLYECKKLKVLFHLSVAHNLMQLRELYVSSCDDLETVFAKEVEGREGEGVVANVTFTHLATIKLLYLPNLASFCKDNLLPSWPSLENVEVRNCPEMKTFDASATRDGNQSTAKLKEIKLDGLVINLNGNFLNKVIQNHNEKPKVREYSKEKLGWREGEQRQTRDKPTTFQGKHVASRNEKHGRYPSPQIGQDASRVYGRPEAKPSNVDGASSSRMYNEERVHEMMDKAKDEIRDQVKAELQKECEERWKKLEKECEERWKKIEEETVKIMKLRGFPLPQQPSN